MSRKYWTWKNRAALVHRTKRMVLANWRNYPVEPCQIHHFVERNLGQYAMRTSYSNEDAAEVARQTKRIVDLLIWDAIDQLEKEVYG